MNKYTLGTIVGASLLGFAKSKLGSSVKLKAKKYQVNGFRFQFVLCDADMYVDHELEPQLEKEEIEEIFQKYQSVNADGIEVIQSMRFELDIYDEMDGYGDEFLEAYLNFFIHFLDESNIEEILSDIFHTVRGIVEDYRYDMSEANIDNIYSNEEDFLVYLDEKTGKWKSYSAPKSNIPNLRVR
tara:strand:+ start:132 stop:683 length:552 start_codon:yes stop_codon:yes gene_type:complete